MTSRTVAGAVLAMLAANLSAAAQAQAQAQDVPVIDTEDATLGSAEVGPGGLHGLATIDLRNGDYARGAYDDDDASLARLPVHVALGFAAVLRRGADGAGTLFVVGQSSNGFHAPAADERRDPRSWYESNTIVALAWRPVDGLTTAAAYAVKVSPNGVSATTQEASLSGRYAADDGVGRWRPQIVMTRRTRGDSGTYTLIGVAPEIPIGSATLAFPLSAGIGWGGFYAPGSGDRLHASLGMSFETPLSKQMRLRVQGVALARDARLASLDAPRGSDAPVIPLVTIAIVSHW